MKPHGKSLTHIPSFYSSGKTNYQDPSPLIPISYSLSKSPNFHTFVAHITVHGPQLL
jgi:hypothetical protein